MTITYDAPAPRRAVSAPTSLSLLNRIQKPPLASRLGSDDSSVKTSDGPYVYLLHQLLSLIGLLFSGAIRSRPRRGPKAPAAVAPRPGPKKPKTVEDLDKELDAFMGDAEPATATTVPVQPATVATANQDVEMA